MCAESVLWRFSYLWYFLMKCRQSLLNTMVRFIFIDLTIPVRIRPRMLTLPVNGHFLSMYDPSIASRGVLKPSPTFLVNLCSFALTVFPITRFFFWKMGACFWYALSVCSDMVADVVVVDCVQL